MGSVASRQPFKEIIMTHTASRADIATQYLAVWNERNPAARRAFSVGSARATASPDLRPEQFPWILYEFTVIC
jgi:hypothetical protein